MKAKILVLVLILTILLVAKVAGINAFGQEQLPCVCSK